MACKSNTVAAFNSVAASTGYTIFVRRQYTFTTDSETLARITTLSVSADNDVAVNLFGYAITTIGSGLLLVKIVVGPADPRTEATRDQNRRFRQVLRQYDVAFTVATVMQIVDIQAVSGTPGSLRIVLAALACSDIPLLSVFQGEPGPGRIVASTLIGVPEDDLTRALALLRNFDRARADEVLCINRDNIE